MITLRSHVNGQWHEAGDGFASLYDPCSEEEIARASTAGIDFAAALAFARERGGPALRELSFADRGEILMKVSKALHEHRDELIALSLRNTGATRKDAKFDLDGATGTLSYYSYLAKELGEGRWHADGEGVQLTRSARFWGQHLWVPVDGVAVHINAFNFPAWGFAEKAACALLAGVPVITKPATSTAMVTARCVEILVDSDVLPEGALSFIAGSTGNLLDLMGPQDVLAFTGSADTGLRLRSNENILRTGTRVNIEADSLNAAVLGPDVDSGSDTLNAFYRDVEREITQKSGQKCTAVRRIFVPRERADEVEEELAGRLDAAVVGNPQDSSVTMGPLATRQQLDDAVAGVATLAAEGRVVFGNGERVDGAGNDAGKGYFFAPALLRVDDPAAATKVHEHEVFGPVATIMPYEDEASVAAKLVARGGGSLVSSVYSDDRGFVGEMIAGSGPWNGRVYLGSKKVAELLPGSGVALPQVQHGGPGRAGGGSELGALRGLELYLQRVAVTGDRAMIEKLLAGS